MATGGRGLNLRGNFQRYITNATFHRQHYPIPREQTPYAFAKIAEYIEKDLSKAEQLYRQAIEIGERPESAVKDLAGILHQQGKTKEACELLQDYKHLFIADQTKYENLLRNLQKQIFPSQNTFNKAVKISNLSPMSDELTVRGLFLNPTRILHIEMGVESDGRTRYAILRFASHSGARKTLEGYQGSKYKLEWMSVNGEITGEVNLENPQQEQFSLFSKTKEKRNLDESWLYTYLPENNASQGSKDLIDELLENSLFTYLRKPNFELKVSAKPFDPEA
ncbi:unnamed protein product [Blepharisma stoltei]|uniref:Tetratricopeptide repeat protein n=1 Tax=Blepharisma stoltei TaxID=1481888 RepID=A0AAU9K0I1_9CILI|nr:unnamed protein product [Blepharisma stoltei]